MTSGFCRCSSSSHASDVLENAFPALSDDDYEVAKRIRLTELDLDAEAAKPNSMPLMWGRVAAFLK